LLYDFRYIVFYFVGYILFYRSNLAQSPIIGPEPITPCNEKSLHRFFFCARKYEKIWIMAQPITPCNDSHFKRRLETAFFRISRIHSLR